MSRENALADLTWEQRRAIEESVSSFLTTSVKIEGMDDVEHDPQENEVHVVFTVRVNVGSFETQRRAIDEALERLSYLKYDQTSAYHAWLTQQGIAGERRFRL